MKKYLIFVFIIMMGLQIGCTPNQDLPKDTVPNNNVPQVQEDEEKREGYSIVKPSIVPQEVLNWFNSFGNVKGAYVYQHPDYTYLKIASGSENDVNIKQFNNQDYEKKITVEFVKTNKNLASIILKIPSKSVATYNVYENSSLIETKQKVITAVLNTPKENEKIANPVAIKGKIAVFEGTFIVRVIDGNEKIIKEEVLQTAGAPVWGSFNSVISYPVPDTNSGRIEIGEYSAKDGSYVLYVKRNVSFK